MNPVECPMGNNKSTCHSQMTIWQKNAEIKVIFWFQNLDIALSSSYQADNGSWQARLLNAILISRCFKERTSVATQIHQIWQTHYKDLYLLKC